MFARRIFCTLLACLFFMVLALPAWAVKEKEEGTSGGLETTAESAVLMEAHSGRVLWSKNPDKELPMASVTKIMTLLLAVEAVEQGQVSLKDRVVASENAWEMGGSQIYLEPGEEFSLEEMLIAVAVGSANDASVAVAEHILGSEEAFVEAMNRRAKELGLKHTHFVNCTGLPAPGHYTSAYDMAVILRECLKYPLFRRISSIYEYDLRGGKFKLWNTNKLLKWYEGVDAGKTGWTNEAKYCLASSAVRDGLRLIVVVLGTPEPKSHFRESIKLYKYGFARYKAVNIYPAGARVKSIPVSKGVVDRVDVVAREQVTVVTPKGEDRGLSTHLELPASVTAPVKKGQQLGFCIVKKNGQELLRVPLVARYEVKKASLMQQIKKVFFRQHSIG
ncbi:D-alanyl-D-alanine carboxypeptidase family protein [Desulfofundulus thermocisternus]|uniref:D-alanyl-D-alanine carboxypeptidase family protein n=1 Tax=Desulfofundulus thermocisternus TaxID=42471 RepID=UPI00217F0A22|nr:D-alanyl-D-alanine carboxypeptidase family protein [Desulfofundulus thermocisternus]MCS5694737.1 D-alanyl-D-alanine carboxypeptidase [Desulfofundulus thermocisternus]